MHFEILIISLIIIFFLLTHVLVIIRNFCGSRLIFSCQRLLDLYNLRFLPFNLFRLRFSWSILCFIVTYLFLDLIVGLLLMLQLFPTLVVPFFIDIAVILLVLLRRIVSLVTTSVFIPPIIFTLTLIRSMILLVAVLSISRLVGLLTLLTGCWLFVVFHLFKIISLNQFDCAQRSVRHHTLNLAVISNLKQVFVRVDHPIAGMQSSFV